MASQIPSNQDFKFEHTIKDIDGAVINLSLLDGYAVHWFYKESATNRVELAKYSKNTVVGYTENLDITNEATGRVISNVQRADNVVPEGKKLYWQFYTQATDGNFDTVFQAATCEIEAGQSCNADAIAVTL